MPRDHFLGQGYLFVNEYPFDSTIKRMTVIYLEPKGRSQVVLTKGALER